MRVFKNSNDPTDTKVYVAEDPKIKIPANFAIARMIYLVKPVEEDQADYSIKVQGKSYFFKFVSDAGKQAWERGGTVFKVSDPLAASCPDCLIAEGHKDRLHYFSSPENDDVENEPDLKPLTNTE